MSHIVSIAIEIGEDADSIAAVRQVCKELGLTFKADQATYNWWGFSVGDYPLPTGFMKEDLGKCKHAIGIPGTNWEVGLAKPRTGKGLRLLFDFFGSDGAPILKALGGEQANKFKQLYGVARAEIAAKKLGHTVKRQVMSNGAINVVITGGSL
jgi:hypothetical protein